MTPRAPHRAQAGRQPGLVDYNDGSSNANITNVLTLAGTVTVTGKHPHTNTNYTAPVDTFYALAAPNASHRVVLLALQVDGAQMHNRDGSGSGKVGVCEIAHLEGLGYDDEFTERLCEGPGDDDVGTDRAGRDEDEDGDGDGGYVLVAALVGANRKAIYRVPLTAPQSKPKL